MYKDINPLGIRFPAELRDKIAKSAEENLRSINAEVVAQMLAAYKEKTTLAEFSDGELIDEMIKRWGEIECRYASESAKVRSPHRHTQPTTND